MADSILGAKKIGAMTLEECQARFSGISLVSVFFSAEAASAFSTDAEGGQPGRGARRAGVVICYRCGSLGGHTNRNKGCDKPPVSNQRLLEVHRPHGVAASVGREALHACYHVSHVYYVEGFKKNLLLSTVAL
ncbi:unnamed protein product, partial [Heterosigma akashiwo]